MNKNTIAQYVLLPFAFTIWIVPVAAQTPDSLDKVYEMRKQHSIERFGPRCEVGWNGFPRYCDDIEALSIGITAETDTEKAWQFINKNRTILGVENAQEELEIDLEYSPFSPGDTLIRRIRFKQMTGDFELAGFGYYLEFDTSGRMIVALSGQFIPEAKDFDLSNCIGEEEARRNFSIRFGIEYDLTRIIKQILFLDGKYQAYYLIAKRNASTKQVAIGCSTGNYYDLDYLKYKESVDIVKILKSSKYDLGKPVRGGMPRSNSESR